MLISHLRFPDLPNFANQIRTWFQGWFAWLPSGRHDLTRGTNMLKGLDLTDQLGYVPANRWSDSLHGLNDPIRVDQKTTPDVYSCFFIVDTVSTSDAASSIRQHRKGNPTLHHLREFFLLPDLVGKAAICAACQKLDSERFELFVLDGNCRQFSRSDESKITRIETEDDPLSFVIG